MSVTLLRDLSWSSATAGFVAVLVGFTSSVAIVFQAAQAFGATPEQITSWMWALGLGMGLCSAIPSLIDLEAAGHGRVEHARCGGLGQRGFGRWVFHGTGRGRFYGVRRAHRPRGCHGVV